MMRSVCERPFFGGMKSSTRSVKRSRPTLSLLRMALKASRQATSAASSRFDCDVAAEISRSAHVHHQHDRQLALLGEFLDEGGPEPRGHVPIDRADLVARLIFAHFLEVHPASFEDAVVIAGEDGLDETLGLDLERADFLQDVRGCSRLVISSERSEVERSVALARPATSYREHHQRGDLAMQNSLVRFRATGSLDFAALRSG